RCRSRAARRSPDLTPFGGRTYRTIRTPDRSFFRGPEQGLLASGPGNTTVREIENRRAPAASLGSPSMPRPRCGRDGGSAGVAEHRVAEIRRVITLSRTTPRIRAIALVCVAALGFAVVPSAATAQTGSSLAATRAQIDATAGQWFAAQRQVA